MAIRFLLFGLIAVMSLRLKLERTSSERLSRISEHKELRGELKNADGETVRHRINDQYLTVAAKLI